MTCYSFLQQAYIALRALVGYRGVGAAPPRRGGTPAPHMIKVEYGNRSLVSFICQSLALLEIA
jgi:hypothetical protein